MNATLNTGSTIGNFRIVEFIKISTDNRIESYIASSDRGEKALLKICRTTPEQPLPVEFEAGDLYAQNDVFAPTIASGSITIDGSEYQYIIREFVDGERLADLLAQRKRFTWDEALPIVVQLLKALDFLHTQTPPIIHNDVTPRNVIIRNTDGQTSVRLIGTGHLSHRTSGRASFCKKDLNNWYRAPETFPGIFDEQSDLFATGVLWYAMMTGSLPWCPAGSEADPKIERDRLKSLRAEGLLIPEELSLTPFQRALLEGLLALDFDRRFKRAASVLKAIDEGRIPRELDRPGRAAQKTARTEVKEAKEASESESVEKNFGEMIKQRSGGGFADVAGLEEVKSTLRKEVLFVLENRDKAEKYRLKIPNGMLLYGPPGCGKTFIAEKFAQESRLNFLMVKSSDLGSIYIHGSQTKIAELFDQAAQKAPTVLCFDELDGIVPDRTRISNEGQAGEVNEFLSQLNNCSERGIFVIGTSNRPEKIDPAILRTGRMDKLIYIPMPDLEARKELFRLNLEGRVCEEGIDCDRLARESQGFTSSDIEFIVNQTALQAAMDDLPISQQMLLARIPKTRRSVTNDQVREYELLRKKFEDLAMQAGLRRIGFNLK